MQLTRSNTAPTRNSLHERRKAKQASGKQLQLDEDVVLKLRRWIIGIAVGESIALLVFGLRDLTTLQWSLTWTTALCLLGPTHQLNLVRPKRKTCEGISLSLKLS
jgi:hypothetical protein